MAAVPLRRKLEILADAAKYDASCASGGAPSREAPKGGMGSSQPAGICHSYTPDGRCVSLLKILLTNHCVYDCQYCVNRRSSDVERATFEPAEVVTLVLEFYRRNFIEGLFLSSGVLGTPDVTMERMIDVARALRREHRFGGYIHLKAAPGVAPRLLEEAGRFADRLSVNIELPTADDLAALAPDKTMPAVEASMDTIAGRLREAKESPRAPRWTPPGQSTQMIVGATPASDAEVLATSTRLYRSYGLRRVYYSAYSPIPHADLRLPAKSPPLVREHRLYEADWLVRFYGFEAEELVEGPTASLDLEIDPKLAWALRHRERFPVDVNTAPREDLLRVPGLGVRSVDRIVSARRHRALRMADLARLRAVVRKAAPFLVTADGAAHATRLLERPDLRQQLAPARQLGLFDALAASPGEAAGSHR